MSLVYNYEFEELHQTNELMSEILTGLYLILVACIAINLFIALLSEAFAGVHSKAAGITYLVEAKRLLLAEKKYGLKEDFDSFLFKSCSPMVS